jgi:hypothetical protein
MIFGVVGEFSVTASPPGEGDGDRVVAFGGRMP